MERFIAQVETCRENPLNRSCIIYSLERPSDPAEASGPVVPEDVIPCLRMDDMWTDAKMPELLKYLRRCSQLSLPKGWEQLVPQSFETIIVD